MSESNETVKPKFPFVEVQLTGEDGNGFVIVSRVRMAMKRAGVSEEECKAYFDEALSGDYDHLLQTTLATVTVD